MIRRLDSIRVVSKSHFINLVLFELENDGVDEVVSLIPEVLLVISRSKICGNVVVHMSIEKR